MAGGDKESDPEGMFLSPAPKEEEVSRTALARSCHLKTITRAGIVCEGCDRLG